MTVNKYFGIFMINGNINEKIKNILNCFYVYYHKILCINFLTFSYVYTTVRRLRYTYEIKYAYLKNLNLKLFLMILG